MGLLDDAIREHLELKRRRGADASEVSRQESDALGPVRRTPEGQPDLSDLPDVPATEEPEADELAAAHDVPSAPVAWHEEQTAVHSPAPEPVYEPPPVPSAAAEPPAAYEPPPVPSAAAEPPAAYEPPASYEPPPVPPSYAPDPQPGPEPDFDPFPELADEEPEAPAPEPEERQSLLSRFKRGRKQAQGPAGQPPAADEPEPPPASYAAAPTHAAPAPYAGPRAHEPDVVPADDEPAGEDLLEETPDFLEETPEHDRLWFEQRPPRDFDFDG